MSLILQSDSTVGIYDTSVFYLDMNLIPGTVSEYELEVKLC